MMRTVLLLCLSLAIVACDGSMRTQGIVVTPDGVPIDGATITVTRKSADNPRVLTAKSGPDGCFLNFGVVSPVRQDYVLRVTADGRQPAEGIVQSMRENFLVVKLQPDTVLTPSEVMPATADPCSPDVWRRAGLSGEDAELLRKESLRLVAERKCLLEDVDHVEVRKVVRNGANIVVDLVSAPPGRHGSGVTIEFSKKAGAWTHSCTRGFIE